MSEPGVLAEPYDDLDQQRTAAKFGLWVFLATEILFFSGLFTGYSIYRTLYPEAFVIAGRETLLWAGNTMTGLLLTSSLTVALAVKAAEQGRRGLVEICIGATLLLGLTFLVLKGYEWWQDIAVHHHWPTDPQYPLEPDQTRLFFSFYFIMTFVHAVHMTIGMGIWIVLLLRTARRRLVLGKSAAIDVAGLYWHFVDIVWIFVWPLLYLLGRAQ